MSKIDKIRNYNQILLAIAGTIGIVFLLFVAIIALVDLSEDFFRNDDVSNNGILAVEQTEQLLEDSLRRQIISFSGLQIIDSASQTYLLPVTQANLIDAESTGDLLGLIDIKTSGRSYREYYNSNIYNNLLIHSTSTGTSKLIFKNRISIEDFIIHKFGDNKYIVIPACSIDSNKDEILNDEDLQELFIYDLQNNKLNKIKSKENYTTLRAFQPDKSNDLIVHFGIDRDKNGIFESSKEPMVFYKVNLIEMKLEEFVSEINMNKLQELLEGKQ